MTREDLIQFSNNQKWRRAEIAFYEQLKKDIGRLGAVLSDMPKGSPKVQDKEAESLIKLLDQIDILKKEIEEDAIETEKEIKEQLKLLETKQGILLYHYYVVGSSIKYIAKQVLHYDEKYTYKLKDKALDEFDRYHEKKG